MSKYFSVKDLMERYGATSAAIRKFINSKIDIINKDGIHAKKIGRSWRFDSEAAKIIDELRNADIEILTQENEELRIALDAASKRAEEIKRLLDDTEARADELEDRLQKLQEVIDNAYTRMLSL